MNISGIRPKQEFYAGMEKQEPEKKEMHRLNQVAIRMVEMPPLFSEEPMNGPAAAVKVMADTFRDYDREVVAVVNLRADMRPININISLSAHKKFNIQHSTFNIQKNESEHLENNSSDSHQIGRAHV